MKLIRSDLWYSKAISSFDKQLNNHQKGNALSELISLIQKENIFFIGYIESTMPEKYVNGFIHSKLIKSSEIILIYTVYLIYRIAFFYR